MGIRHWVRKRLAEDAEAVVLPNDKLAKTLTGAVDFLSRELSANERHRAEHLPSVPPRSEEVPTLFLVLYGLADEPSASAR